MVEIALRTQSAFVEIGGRILDIQTKIDNDLEASVPRLILPRKELGTAVLLKHPFCDQLGLNWLDTIENIGGVDKLIPEKVRVVEGYYNMDMEAMVVDKFQIPYETFVLFKSVGEPTCVMINPFDHSQILTGTARIVGVDEPDINGEHNYFYTSRKCLPNLGIATVVPGRFFLKQEIDILPYGEIYKALLKYNNL